MQSEINFTQNTCDNAKKKYEVLRSRLRLLDRVLLAFSGGVDSSFLLKACLDCLGRENVLAITARSETYPDHEFEGAKKLADNLNADLRIINTSELNIAEFSNNPVNRCYYCKKELFSLLDGIAREGGYGNVLDGSNASDTSDHRPGAKSAKELGVLSPLQEAGLEKEEIRFLSKMEGLPTWNKGSFACLASRFPYGEKITADKLDMVRDAESFLFKLGFRQFRVRHHNGKIARIEVLKGDFSRIIEGDTRKKIVEKMSDLGYLYVSLDMEGYKTGSMNKVLGEDSLSSGSTA